MDRGDAVFTFYAGTPPHTFNIMTTTNIQYLNDQELEQVAGGFRLWRFIKGIFGFGKKAKKRPHYDGNYFGNNAITK